jgi:hypothetical protein
MERKLYTCEIPGCNKEVAIRSRIKQQGKYTGLKACPSCKNKLDGGSFKSKNKFTEKNKEVRSCLKAFFDEAIVRLGQNPVCQNCGCKIVWWKHPVNNIAHILSKSHYKSVMCHPDNVLFLCDSKDREDGKSCHREFDGEKASRPEMPVFQLALEKFKKFSANCLEKGKERSIFEENL